MHLRIAGQSLILIASVLDDTPGTAECHSRAHAVTRQTEGQSIGWKPTFQVESHGEMEPPPCIDTDALKPEEFQETGRYAVR